MANHAQLNNVEHKDLKVITEKSEKYGSNAMYSRVFPFEFREVQGFYPIFFNKDKDSNFFALALFGFERGENLYLKDEEWDAEYIPLMVEKDPFLIGFQEMTEGGETTVNRVIHIDLDSPRVSYTEGQPVFLPHGGQTEYLERMSAILKKISDAEEFTKKFFAHLEELDLLEPVNVDIKLRDGTANRLAGFYTINEEKVYALQASVTEELNQTGVLMLIYMVMASHINIRKLAAIRNSMV